MASFFEIISIGVLSFGVFKMFFLRAGVFRVFGVYGARIRPLRVRLNTNILGNWGLLGAGDSGLSRAMV